MTFALFRLGKLSAANILWFYALVEVLFSKVSRIFKRRKGISPLIATIILVAITVAGGLLIYSMFISTGAIWGAKGQVSIENIKLVKDSSGAVTFSITIKNTGNKPVAADGLEVKLAGQSINLALNNPLQPGQSVAFVDTVQGTFVIGNSYTVTIKATFTDGSVFTDTITVVCSSA